jgi:hypothetical protein
MKKLYFLLIISMVFVCGCASSRIVRENLFISRSPDATVHVDPAFKYIGSTVYTYSRDSIDRSRMLFNKAESFMFIKEKSPEGIVSSMISLSIRTVETFFSTTHSVPSKRNLESGIIKFGNNNYDYITRMIYPSMEGGISKYLKDNGHALPRCIITKEYVRIPFPNTTFSITYVEALPDSNNQCNDWEDREVLRDAQREFVKSFSKRSRESFQIIE